MNETILICHKDKHHKLSIYNDNGELQLTIRILGLTNGINVDLTMETEGGITVKEYEYAPKSKTVFTHRFQELEGIDDENKAER